MAIFATEDYLLANATGTNVEWILKSNINCYEIIFREGTTGEGVITVGGIEPTGEFKENIISCTITPTE